MAIVTSFATELAADTVITSSGKLVNAADIVFKFPLHYPLVDREL